VSVFESTNDYRRAEEKQTHKNEFAAVNEVCSIREESAVFLFFINDFFGVYFLALYVRVYCIVFWARSYCIALALCLIACHCRVSS